MGAAPHGFRSRILAISTVKPASSVAEPLLQVRPVCMVSRSLISPWVLGPTQRIGAGVAVQPVPWTNSERPRHESLPIRSVLGLWRSDHRHRRSTFVGRHRCSGWRSVPAGGYRGVPGARSPLALGSVAGALDPPSRHFHHPQLRKCYRLGCGPCGRVFWGISVETPNHKVCLDRPFEASPNPRLNFNLTCHAFHSLSTARYSGFPRRPGAGGAASRHSLTV